MKLSLQFFLTLLPALPFLCLTAEYDPQKCQPQRCGNLTGVRYPFWIQGKQPDYCGFPSFELRCADEKSPPSLAAQDSYHVLDISYETQTVKVAAASPADCFVPHKNVSFSLTPFTVSSSNRQLIFAPNCSIRRSSDMEIVCHGRQSLAYLGGEYGAAADDGVFGSCVTAVVPFLSLPEADISRYSEILASGFLLNWTAPDCSECRASHGQCGYNSQTRNFMCICPDSVHWRSCYRSSVASISSEVDDEVFVQLENADIEHSKAVDSAVLGKYNLWRREYDNEHTDTKVKFMRDQMIMARVYMVLAKSKSMLDLNEELLNRLKESQRVVGKATADADLPQSAAVTIKEMNQVLSKAKGQMYDCNTFIRNLRGMLQAADEQVRGLKKQSTFLSQLAAKTIPNAIHCLSMRLSIDYYLLPPEQRKFPRGENLENPSLYHYALFSDNVLAASVVVNSTIMNAKEPEKHVFHLVTDKLNFGAMNMWFLLNPPGDATIHVENVDDFKWLNSSYCPVLHQLESAAMKEYYFTAAHPTTLSAGSSNLKYRNPKYLSMLNHLRFYLPQVYPKLNKILFLDDDIVVQKDLTPLWYEDLKGNVNGAVETCGESFHRFDKYLNFSNPHIAQNFDPNACGWAYGMNMFDLDVWKKKDITGIYHKWQTLNEDRALWKLGTLPPGLLTFYKLTHPLNKSWHVLGLGYNPSIDRSEIENAAVVHYNGNMKPWLELAMTKYRHLWTRYINYDHSYIRNCKLRT